MKANVKEKQMKPHLKNVGISPQAAEAIRKGPSPEAIKLLKAFLMQTSVPRVMAQRIREREVIG
ncbi:hypothetical protein FOA24_22805 [Bacillus thuringiensis]|uniref:hypothetical protein n=1 Tax=Bacillus thuringiensis TaxID=1428 RepID=UPI00333A430B